MASKVRWGVIRCGGIAARRTIPEFVKMAGNAEIVSVMDIDAERAKEVAEQFGVEHSCDTEEALLAQELRRCMWHRRPMYTADRRFRRPRPASTFFARSRWRFR